MSKRVKVLLAFIGIFLCIILIGGGIFLLQENKEKWAPNDVYVFESSGYMAFEAKEDKYIMLLLCTLHRDGKNPMEQYEKIDFVTDKNVRYQSSFSDKMNDSFFNDDEIITCSSMEFGIYGDFVQGEKLNFTSIILTKKDGTETRREFGKIEIEIIEDSDIRDIINPEISDIYSGNLSEFNCTINNEMESEVLIQKIYLGEGFHYSFQPAKVSSGESIKFCVEIDEPESYSQNVSFCVLKPKLMFEIKDGVEQSCSAKGNTVYINNVSDKTLREYLLDCADGKKEPND